MYGEGTIHPEGDFIPSYARPIKAMPLATTLSMLGKGVLEITGDPLYDVGL